MINFVPRETAAFCAKTAPVRGAAGKKGVDPEGNIILYYIYIIYIYHDIQILYTYIGELEQAEEDAGARGEQVAEDVQGAADDPRSGGSPQPLHVEERARGAQGDSEGQGSHRHILHVRNPEGFVSEGHGHRHEREP